MCQTKSSVVEMETGNVVAEIKKTEVPKRMKKIQIQCDRCGRLVEGCIDKNKDGDIISTGGFYMVADGSWKDFGRWEEEYVCDECMHSDPKYKKLCQE